MQKSYDRREIEDNKQKKKPQRKQAHQNTFAFKHNPYSKLTKKIAAIPIVDLCRRCTDKIVWKKKYRKYKIQKYLSKCTVCQEKNISLAYNIVCTPCGVSKNICRMCKVLLIADNVSPSGLDSVNTSADVVDVNGG